jgi:hypothetical protein
MVLKDGWRTLHATFSILAPGLADISRNHARRVRGLIGLEAGAGNPATGNPEQKYG